MFADISEDLRRAHIDVCRLVKANAGEPLVEGHRRFIVADEDQDRVLRHLVGSSCHEAQITAPRPAKTAPLPAQTASPDAHRFPDGDDRTRDAIDAARRIPADYLRTLENTST